MENGATGKNPFQQCDRTVEKTRYGIASDALPFFENPIWNILAHTTSQRNVVMLLPRVLELLRP